MMKVDVFSVKEDFEYLHLSFSKDELVLGRRSNGSGHYMVRDKNNEWHIVEEYRMTIAPDFPFDKFSKIGFFLLSKKQLIKELPTHLFLNDSKSIKFISKEG